MYGGARYEFAAGREGTEFIVTKQRYVDNRPLCLHVFTLVKGTLSLILHCALDILSADQVSGIVPVNT